MLYVWAYHVECDGEERETEKNMKWGDFLKADTETWHAHFAFRGNHGGRGRDMGGLCRNDLDPEGVVLLKIPVGTIGLPVLENFETDDHLMDTSASPIRPREILYMSRSEYSYVGAKKRLILTCKC
jgi:hypothetical protein